MKIVICHIDGSEKTMSSCYFGNCSNEQYGKCYPEEIDENGLKLPLFKFKNKIQKL